MTGSFRKGDRVRCIATPRGLEQFLGRLATVVREGQIVERSGGRMMGSVIVLFDGDTDSQLVWPEHLRLVDVIERLGEIK